MPVHRIPRPVATAFLLASVLALGGCQPRDSRLHLTYWEKWTSREGDAMRQVVDAFNRSQTRIQVDYLPVSSIELKTLVAIAGGDPPDIAGLLDRHVTPYVAHRALLPLDEFIRQDGLSNAQFLDRYMTVYGRMAEHDGHVYAAVATPSCTLLHWNKEIFREAGLDPERPPRTLAELKTMADRITRRDPATGTYTRIGFLPQEPNWFVWAYPAWFGGQIWDGHDVTIGTVPQNLQAYRWVRGFSEQYGVGAMQAFTSGFGNFESPQSGFLSGRVGMVLQGVFMNNFISMYNPGLDYGVAPWPVAPGGPDHFTTAEADILVIPRGAKHPAESWEFLRYMSTMQNGAQSFEELGGLERLCLLQKKISPFREWSPYFTQHPPHPYAAAFREAAASPHAYSHPRTAIWPEYERELNSLFERVLLEEITPEAGVASSQARLEASNRYQEKSTQRRTGDTR